MTTIRHGGPSGLRIGMRSAERGVNPAVLSVTGGRMVFADTLRGGGVGMIRSNEMRQSRYSSISLIPLWLSPLNRPTRFRRGRKAGTRATPPKKAGGHVTLDSATESAWLYPGPMGSLSSSFIPAGRLRTAPQERR